MGLEKGHFYEDVQTGNFYVWAPPRLVDVSGGRYIPSTNIQRGLSSNHGDKVEENDLVEVDPLVYLERRRQDFNGLVAFVRGHLPELQDEGPVTSK